MGVDGKDITYDAPDYQVPPVISISPRRVQQMQGKPRKDNGPGGTG